MPRCRCSSLSFFGTYTVVWNILPFHFIQIWYLNILLRTVRWNHSFVHRLYLYIISQSSNKDCFCLIQWGSLLMRSLFTLFTNHQWSGALHIQRWHWKISVCVYIGCDYFQNTLQTLSVRFLEGITWKTVNFISAWRKVVWNNKEWIEEAEPHVYPVSSLTLQAWFTLLHFAVHITWRSSISDIIPYPCMWTKVCVAADMTEEPEST